MGDAFTGDVTRTEGDGSKERARARVILLAEAAEHADHMAEEHERLGRERRDEAETLRAVIRRILSR